MDLQEFQMLLNAAELDRVLLEKSGEPRLEAFSGNAIYSRRGMTTMNKYKTVKEVCDLTGLTRKHLHYFHHENVVRAVAYMSSGLEMAAKDFFSFCSSRERMRTSRPVI